MKTKLQRAAKGRAKFYSRDSGGKHEQTPAQYVEWAQRQAKELGLQFNGIPAEISHMIKSGRPVSGDLFFDYCVSGNKMSRPALDALREAVRSESTISHILVPRRNRLARPDSAIEGLMLENELRESGITLVYMDRMLEPLKRGRRQDLGVSIVALFDFEQSGKERTDLAVKFIYAQLSLAQMGFSTGGRPPFAFRRVLVAPDGKAVRELEEGEVIRRQGHHVVWVPGPESEMELVREILDMLERMPATQVARYLNAKGIPSPDAGRRRKDLGIEHEVSGKWYPNTIKNIATNPLLRAVTSYGRRSMGDQRRMTPTGPRFLEDQDFRPDGLPKVIRNDESQVVTGTARFVPLIDAEKAERLASILKKRAGTQRAKPRSRKPEENPLGARVFDANCNWPMYRESYQGSFRYVCAKYQQFRPHQCDHNGVDGVAATKLALAVIRQKVLLPGWRSRLESKLRQRAVSATRESRTDREISAKQTELSDLRSQMALAEQNAARAKSEEMFQAIQQVHDELRSRELQL